MRRIKVTLEEQKVLEHKPGGLPTMEIRYTVGDLALDRELKQQEAEELQNELDKRFGWPYVITCIAASTTVSNTSAKRRLFTVFTVLVANERRSMPTEQIWPMDRQWFAIVLGSQLGVVLKKFSP